MPARTRLTSLLLLSITVVAVVFLSASLSGLPLHPGTPFPSGDAAGTGSGPALVAFPMKEVAFPLLRGVMAVAFLFIFALLSINLIIRLDWKRVFRLLFFLAVLLAVLLFFPRLFPAQPTSTLGDQVGTSGYPSFNYPVAPIGKPPLGFVWAVFAVLLLAVFLFGLWLVLRQPPPSRAADRISQAAGQAVMALQSGQDIKGVIIRCYLRMSQVLQEEQGLARTGSMTASEFKELLIARGVPPDPVRQLTLLFEAARYGLLPPRGEAEQTCNNCLNEIIEYSRSKAG